MFIPGLLPGLNESLGKANKRYGKTNGYAVLKKCVEMEIGLYIRRAALEHVRAARIEFLWKEKDRRRDPDNIVSAKKYILDGLVREGVLPGDGQKVVKGLSDDWEVDKANPGVVVKIIPSYPECLE